MKCLRCGTFYVKAGEEVCTTCQLKGYKTEKMVKRAPNDGLKVTNPDQVYYIDGKPYMRKEIEYLYHLRNVFGEKIYLKAKVNYDRCKGMPVEDVIKETRDKLRPLDLKQKD